MTGLHPNAFAWFLYGGSAVLYTAAVLRGELPPGGTGLLSKKNMRTTSSMITTHAVMLAVVIYSVHMAAELLPFLPDWLTIRVSGRWHMTLFGLLLLLTFPGVAELERRWLYVEAHESQSDSTENPG